MLAQQPVLMTQAVRLAACYRFMCSFVPEKRPDWAEAWSRLIRPGGELITLIFPVGLGTPSTASAAVACAIAKTNTGSSKRLSLFDGEPSQIHQSCKGRPLAMLGLGHKVAKISQSGALSCIQRLLEGCLKWSPSLSACSYITAPPSNQSQ